MNKKPTMRKYGQGETAPNKHGCRSIIVGISLDHLPILDINPKLKYISRKKETNATDTAVPTPSTNWKLDSVADAQTIDIHTRNINGQTALHIAVGFSSSRIVVQTLIKRGADVNKSNEGGNTPLHCAVTFNQNIDVMKDLIKAGADINAQNKNGTTALHRAAEFSRSSSMIRDLIKAGADVNARDKEGKTALQYAETLNNNSAVIRTLINAGAVL